MSIFADSNRVSIRAIAESTTAWGVTPVSGVTRLIRLVSSSLMAKKETKTSDELRADRMVSSVTETAASSEGDIDFEFSAGSHDDFIQAFVLGQWTRPMSLDKFSGLNVAWGANNRIDIAGGDFTAYFTAGRRIVTGGFNNPLNNSYFNIASVALVSGVTQITVSTTTSVAEAGSAKTFVQDANDIVLLKNTSIRLGTGGASTIDSNGTNAFASAITAGQLVVGQTISVDGLGYEIGSFDLTATAPTDAEFVSVSDGVKAVVFEFDNNSSILPNRIAVAIGGSSALTAAALADAINAQRVAGNLSVSATVTGTVVTIRNQNKTGGALAETSANISVTAFAGGSSASGLYTITSLSNDVLTVSPQPVVDANAGGLGVTIKGSMLRNPDDTGNLPHQLIVPQSFTIETAFNDIGQYEVQTGMRVGAWSMNVQAGEIVKGTYSFSGKETKMKTATVLGAAPYTPVRSTSTEVMNATTNVGSLKKNGVALATALQSIELKGDASLRQQTAAGSKFARGVGTGRFNLTGTVTAYFENGEMYNHFINHETVGLSFDFTDLDGNSYRYSVPAVKFTSDDIKPEGIDQDVLEPLEFAAFRDSATGTMFQIDRFSASKSVTF